MKAEFGIAATAENVVVAPGAKPFEQFFCELFLEPGDAVLVFQPAFPTYEPNIARRGARPVYRPLRQENEFRPDLGEIERFVQSEPQAKAIFLNSPHNPTGGVATQEDLKAIADLVRGTNIAVFSRRAVLPHGLGGPAPQPARRAGDVRALRRRLHLLQELQHERLALRLCRRRAAISPTSSAR